MPRVGDTIGRGSPGLATLHLAEDSLGEGGDPGPLPGQIPPGSGWGGRRERFFFFFPQQNQKEAREPLAGRRDWNEA